MRASQLTDNMLWAATAVAKQAIVDNVARVIPKKELPHFIRDNIWKPYYRFIRSRSDSNFDS